jgi:hypothetical protein
MDAYENAIAPDCQAIASSSDPIEKIEKTSYKAISEFRAQSNCNCHSHLAGAG